MKKFNFVYICSPYRSNPSSNTLKAQWYSRFAVKRGCIPVTPHIYFTQFLNDDITEEREKAMALNKVILTKCHELWVFGNEITQGMQEEILEANRLNIPIRHFTEDLVELGKGEK